MRCAVFLACWVLNGVRIGYCPSFCEACEDILLGLLDGRRDLLEIVNDVCPWMETGGYVR